MSHRLAQKCIPGLLHISKHLCKAFPFESYLWAETVKNLLQCKIHMLMTSTRVWLSDRCFAAACSRKTAEVWAERDKLQGDGCIDSTGMPAGNRSVRQSEHETSPEVQLSRLVWQITLPEQNNLTFSFDICFRRLWGDHLGQSHSQGVPVKTTRAVSGCLDDWSGTRASKEYFAWHWWMASREAERCLTC